MYEISERNLVSDVDSDPTENKSDTENSLPPLDTPTPAPRSSTRATRKPNWIKEYVLSTQVTNTPYKLEWLQRALTLDKDQLTTALVKIITDLLVSTILVYIFGFYAIYIMPVATFIQQWGGRRLFTRGRM